MKGFGLGFRVLQPIETMIALLITILTGTHESPSKPQDPKRHTLPMGFGLTGLQATSRIYRRQPKSASEGLR